MRRQNWPVLAPAAVIWIVLVACGGPTSTAALENTSTSASAPGAQTVPATATGPLVEAGMDQPAVSSPAGADAALQAEPETGAPLVAASWDARAIVAAHEAILTDIYSSVLPSVAYVRVENDLASRQPMPFSGSRRAPKGFTVSGEGSAFVWSDQGDRRAHV